MTTILTWIKKHWLVLVLLFIILFLIRNQSATSSNFSTLDSVGSYKSTGIALSNTVPAIGGIFRTSAAPTDTQNRLVIQDTSLSLTVKNVAESLKNILASAQSLGGFLVNSSPSQPQDAASGNITVRVPTDKLDQALTAFKQISSKVVSESVTGNDVTDQYVDLDTQLSILNNTKLKFQAILDKAVTVSDLLNVQQQLMNIQSQIDSVIGQQKYLEQSAKLSRVTIYLSTDELSLPYAPTNVWRPMVVFKEAVRSLLGTFQSIGSLIIWTVAYLPVIIPVLAIIYFVKRKKILT